MISSIKFNGFLLILLAFISIDLAGQPDHIVNRGERPPVNMSQVPDSSIEPGKLFIKLMPGVEEFIAGKVLEAKKGEYVKTEIGALDDLNIEFGATRYRPLLNGLYDRNSKSWQNQERHRAWGFHLWYEIEIGAKANIIEAAKKYALADEIETAEPVYRKRLISPVPSEDKVYYDDANKNGFPDDPYYENQWHFNNTGQTIWGQEGIPGIDISLEAAWEIETGYSDIIVAVFDDGLDFSHEDLSAHIWDGIGPEGEDTRADDHATHVSGTISAVTNNSTGVAGIAGGTGAGDGVRIMSLDILGGEHELTDLELYVYAADNGAAISQNSWGYLEPDVYNQFALDGIDYFNTYGGGEALVGGGITIFAAGNDDDEGNWYPAYYSGAMAVASYDNRGVRSDFSNYGDWIDISAPGTGILSTIPGNDYSFFQGTSMACPHVSGVAALVLSNVYGILSPQNLWDLLIENVDDIYQYNTTEYQGKLGSGGLNAYEALMAAQSYLGMVAGPQSFSAEPAGPEQIDLFWAKNNDNDNVMIAWSSDDTFGTPVEGYSYSEGEIIEGGGTVIYRSDGNSFSHTGLDPETRYYYRAFSYDGSDNYSLGRNSSAVTERMKYAVNFTVTGQSDEPLENVMIIVTPGGGDISEGENKSTEMWGQGMSSYELQLIDKELKGTASADRGMPKSHHEEEGTWVHWDDGVIAGAIGLDSPGLFYVASRWVPSDLASYEGLFIRRLLFYISNLPNGTTAMIWQGDDELSLTGVYIQEFTPVADSWVEVELIEPYKIDITKELWFGYEIDDPGSGVYSAGRDQSTDHDGKGNKVKLGPDGDWANLSDLGATGDWAIRAFLIEPDTLYTDVTGEASIDAYSGAYYYTAVKEGYPEVAGSLTVDNNAVQVNIKLGEDLAQVPVVTTAAISDIAATTATSGGEVTDDGGAEVTARGVVWSTAEGPSIENSEGYTEDGTGIGEFISELTGLTPGTQYFVRAYATNQEGTSYGEGIEFFTSLLTLWNTLASAEDVENSEVGPDGIVVGAVNFNNDVKYGKGLTPNTGNAQSGVDFPTIVVDPEKGTVEMWAKFPYAPVAYSYGVFGFINVHHWSHNVMLFSWHNDGSLLGFDLTFNGNTRGVNLDNFSPALDTPVHLACVWDREGIDGTGDYMQIYVNGLLVASNSTSNDWGTDNSSGNFRVAAPWDSDFGTDRYSVENIKVWSYARTEFEDVSGVGLPEVITSPVTGITSFIATSGGEVTDDGGAEVTARGVVWSTDEGPSIENSEGYTEDGTGIGEFISELTGLTPGTRYFVRAYATNEEGTAYGEEMSFTTDLISEFTVTFNVTEQDGTPVDNARITIIPEVFSDQGESALTYSEQEFGTEVRALDTGVIREQLLNEQTISGRKLLKPVLFDLTKSSLDFWLHWDSGETHGTVGLTSSGEFSIASRWEPSDLADYDGKYISAISFFPTSADCDYTVRLWDASGNVLYSKLVDDVIVDSWNFVSIDSLYAIDASEELWFGLHLNQGGSYPAGVDDGPAVAGKGDLINGGDGWVSMYTEFGDDYNFNWNLQAFVVSPVTLYTDASGQAALEATVGSYSYVVVKEGYIDVSDVFIVEDSGLNIDVVLEPDIMLPSVATFEVTAVTLTTATSGGVVTDDGGAEVTARGVVWSTAEGPSIENSEGYTEDDTGTGEFISELTGLEPGTKYYVRAYATNSEGTSYGEEMIFNTGYVVGFNVRDALNDPDEPPADPVPGAEIGIVSLNTEDEFFLITDYSGYAEIALLGGEYMYSIYDESFELAEGSFSVTDSDIDITVNLIPMGIDDPDRIFSRINVYPNPGNGIFNIVYEGGTLEGFSLEVISITGNVVYSREFKVTDSLNETIDLRDAGSGIYILRIRGKDKVAVKRLIFL